MFLQLSECFCCSEKSSRREMSVYTQRSSWNFLFFLSAGSCHRAEERRRLVATGLHGVQVSEGRLAPLSFRRRLLLRSELSRRPFFSNIWRSLSAPPPSLGLSSLTCHFHLVWLIAVHFDWHASSFMFYLFIYLFSSSNSWSYSLSFEGHLALPISLLCQRSRLHHSQTVITAASTAGSKA